MTKLPDEGPTGAPVRLGDEGNEAVVELMDAAIIEAQQRSREQSRWRSGSVEERADMIRSIFSALSDAGLAVLPLEATEAQCLAWPNAAKTSYPYDPDALWEMCSAFGVWKVMAAAFRPSQLEKTDE